MNDDQITDLRRPFEAEAENRGDWRMTVVVILVFVTAGVLGFMAPYVVTNSSTTREIQRGDAIQACRAEANSGVTDANTEARRAELSNETLTNRFIELISTRDPEGVAELLPKFAPARTRLENADNTLDVANQNYQAAVRLSQDDPDEFLKQCASGRFDLTEIPNG